MQFSGGVLAWGVLVPLFMYFLGPNLQQFIPTGAAGASDDGWAANAAAVWRYIVRPIAVGGMLVGAVYTLFRMRKNLTSSLGRALSEVRHGTPPMESLARTERYMSSKTVFAHDRGGVRVDDRAVHLLFGPGAGRSGGGDRDAAGRVLLRDGVGKSGGHDRFVQQSHFGTDAFDADHRRAADGGAGRFGNGRSGGGAGGRRGGLRLLRRRGRAVAGLQGRLHSGRHAAHDSNRGTDRRGGRQPGDVLSAVRAATSRISIPAGRGSATRRFRRRRLA